MIEGAGAPDARLIAGRYRLGEVIGRGGMATIHRAIDIRTGRRLAVKLLRPEIVADRDLADRFRREALAATVLRHPAIVACLDTGSDPAGPFMVMELVDGEDLAARLRRAGPLPADDAARMALSIARGLGAAHARGIVHRDVKPGNILLASDGRALITDFGIARLAADAEAAQPGTTLGSIQYFSPEQAQGRATTPATDVYGLGLVLYEGLTGRRPFVGATSTDAALARVDAPAPSVRAVREDVPEALDAIVRRALAAVPADRYPNGTAMAAALDGFVRGTSHRIGILPGRGQRATRTATSGAARAARPVSSAPIERRPVRRRLPQDGGFRRSMAVFGAVAVVIAVVGLGILPRLGLGGVSGALGDALGGAGSAVDATTPRATARSTATPRPTPRPTATKRPTPSPTAVAAGADLCTPLFGLPCGLEAGRYTPLGFEPAFDIELGAGWSTASRRDGLIVLTRDTGTLTIAARVQLIDPSQGTVGDGSAAGLIAALAATDGVSATRPATVTIGGHAGASTDLTPSDDSAHDLFAAGAATIRVEAAGTTRVVALDVDGGPLVLVIAPASGHTLRDLLDTADDAAATIRPR